jgi:hypothetical protein
MREQREKEQQDDFLKGRRDREQRWRESKEADDIPLPPAGVLMPIEDDWTQDLGQDPNETDQERDSRHRRSEWIRRGRQAGITAIGGVTTGAIYESWKNRSKFLLQNSGSMQGRKYPLPPSIPSDGPSDLIPKIPDSPVPAQPVPRAPTERTCSGSIPPIDNYQRAMFVQGAEDKMDCSC